MTEEFYNKNHDPSTGRFTSKGGGTLGSSEHKAYMKRAQDLAEKANEIAYGDKGGTDADFDKVVNQYEKHITSGAFGERLKKIAEGPGSYQEKQAMMGKVLGNWKNYDIPLPGPGVLIDAIY